MADPTVYLRPPGFQWQVLGRELYRGAYPSNVHVEADPWGFASCSFDLARDPFLPQPDLSSFVPCRIEEGGAVLFSGKVQETPARGDPEPLISVSGRGRQYGLDENPIEHSWLHSDLSAWKDVRSIGGYDPALWRPNSLADAGDGVITLGRNVDELWYGTEAQGVYLDLGSEQRVERIELTFTTDNIIGNSVFSLYARGRADDNNISSGLAWTDGFFGGAAGESVAATAGAIPYTWSDAIKYTAGGVVDGTTIGYFNPPARFVAIFLYWTGAGGGAAVGSDHLVKITRIALYGDGAVGAQGRGNLRGSDVVEDLVARASVGIVVPEQSFEPGYYYGDELRTGYEGIGGKYYPLRLPTRLAPGWPEETVLLGHLGAAVTYHDSGGPCLDDNPAGSAYAELGAASNFFWSPSAVWPAAATTWTVAVWFRAHSGAGYVGTDYATLNNRIVASELDSTAPTVGFSDFGAGIRTDGRLLFFFRTNSSTATSSPAKYVADGEWHMLYVARNRHNGTITFALDGDFSEEAWPQSWFGSARSQPNMATLLAFGSRNGGDKQFNGDLAEIAWFHGELSVGWSEHLYHAAKRDIDTPLRRTELVLPGYATSSARTAREGIEPINALHRYVTKVGRDDEMQFRPQPVRPKYALTAAASRKFEQTSLTAADEAYNRALVIGQDLFGNPMRVERTAGQQPEALLELPDHVAPENGELETDTDGWLGSNMTLTWQALSEGRFLAVPISGGAGAHAAVVGLFLGHFLRGRYYRLTLELYSLLGITQPLKATLGNVALGDYGAASASWPSDVWTTASITWIPKRDYFGEDEDPRAFLYLQAPASSTTGIAPGQFYVRRIELRVGVWSMLDRQNDLRTRIIENSAVLTPAIGEAMADGFLRNRARQQLKGSVPVAPGDVVDYLSGAVVHPSFLAADTMELLHIPSLVDPDTGAQGRDGQMVGVSYDCDTELAAVSIDNSRDNFEVMMQRYAMFAGGGVGG